MARPVKILSNVHPAIKAMCKDENSSAHLYAQQGFHLKVDSVTGQFITGYNLPFGVTDEEVLTAKKGSPLAIYKPLVEERKTLERALGKSLTGGPGNNDFLEELYIKVKVKGKSDLVLDLDKPLEKLIYRALIANGFVAESYEGTLGSSNPVQYYFENLVENQEKSKALRKLKNAFRAELVKNEDNKVWLYGVAKYMSLPVTHEVHSDSIYTLIDETVTAETKLNKLEPWYEFTQLTMLDIELAVVWDLATYSMLIYPSDSGSYLHQGQTIGDNAAVAKSNLLDPKYKEIYLKIKDQAFQKLGIKK